MVYKKRSKIRLKRKRSPKRPKIKLKKGELKKYGYSDVKNLSSTRRHIALKSAIKEYGVLSVFRKINVLCIFFKNNSKFSKIFESDKKWIYRNYHVKKNGTKK